MRGVDCYDLPALDLSAVAGLLVGPHVDQEFLYRHRDLVRAYLDGGGIVVFGGHLYREWLPGAGLFVPVPDRRRSTYRVERIADHPLFAGLSPED
ncbi:MAG: phosphate starvation-inducible protein PhoH, partial [Sporichthyaceae bacterium]